MTEFGPFEGAPRPTPLRPLLGLTVLLVDDSRAASDTLRLLCLRSGARLRRADCLHSARRHLSLYRPGVLIVDLGLPDGSGLDLVREVAECRPRIDLVLATSADDTRADDAVAAGADGFLAKPFPGLTSFQNALVSKLPDRAGTPLLRLAETSPPEADPTAYRDDMARASVLLGNATDRARFTDAALFVRGAARCAGDVPLATAAATLPAGRENTRAAALRLASMVDERLGGRLAV